jgi:hypothetical protein
MDDRALTQNALGALDLTKERLRRLLNDNQTLDHVTREQVRDILAGVAYAIGKLKLVEHAWRTP